MRGLLLSVEADRHPGEELLARYSLSEFEGGLPELQAAVGGYIEAAPSDESVTIWCNEDGKILGLPVNRFAMDVWIRWDCWKCMSAGGDWLAGNVVITGGVGPDGETLDLPLSARNWILRVAREALAGNPRPDWERFGLVDREEES